MMGLKYQTLGHGITCIDANYVKPGVACFYLLEQDGEYAVIETGTSHSVASLRTLMTQRDITPQQIRYVIPTHVHLDHAGGAGLMMSEFPEAQMLIHPRGAQHMAQPQRLSDSAKTVYGDEAFATLYGDIVPVDPARIRSLEDGDSVKLSGRRLEMRHTRGHANHHFCVWDETSSGWFSGDMFGVSYPWWRFDQGDFVMPSTTPTQFDPKTYLESLQLLESYQPQRIYLTHFGQISFSAEKAQLLARQVLRYRDIAMENMDKPEQLAALLTQYGLELLGEIDSGGDPQNHRDWLALDTPLNAQGLQVWQQRISASTG